MNRFLPPICYAVTASGELCSIRRGHDPMLIYQKHFNPKENPKIARQSNEALGVTPQQAAAMVAGVTYGWDNFWCDPCRYDENGRRKY